MEQKIKTLSLPSSVSASSTLTSIKVQKGDQVRKGTVLATYGEVRGGGGGEEDTPITSVQFKSTVVGRVYDILHMEGDTLQPSEPLFQVEEICDHSIVVFDMCADCGLNLRRNSCNAENFLQPVSASVSMIHGIPELRVSQKEAEQLGNEDRMRLLTNRKLALIVDLDQTLVHTSMDPNVEPGLPDVYGFHLPDDHLLYHCRLRPHTREFLDRVSKLYELHVFTMGTKSYAASVTHIIDPEGRLFCDRIISRNDCFDPRSKALRLKSVFPCGDSMVAIIDDREDVWGRCPNLIHVKPYMFFTGTADINAPPPHSSRPRPPSHKQQRVGKGAQIPPHFKVRHMPTRHQRPQQQQRPENKMAASREQNGSGHGERIQPQAAPVTEVEVDSGTVPGRLLVSENNSKEVSDRTLADVPSSRLEQEVSSSAAAAAGDNPMEVEVGLPLDVSSSSNAESAVSPVEDAAVPMDTNNNNNNNNNRNSDGGSSDSSSDSSDSSSSSGIDDTLFDQAPGQALASESPLAIEGGEAGDRRDEAAARSEGSALSDHPPGGLEGGVVSGVADNGQTQGVRAPEAPPTRPVDGGGRKTREIHDLDDFLIHLGDILERVHAIFYETYDTMAHNATTTSSSSSSSSSSPSPARQPSTASPIPSPPSSPLASRPAPPPSSLTASSLDPPIPDLKQIIHDLRHSILIECRILFTGVIPTNIPLRKNPEWNTARAFGATIHTHLVPGLNSSNEDDVLCATTHVIAGKPGTSKLLEARRMPGIKIVNPRWLWACAERWKKVDEELYPIPTAPERRRGSEGGARRASEARVLKVTVTKVAEERNRGGDEHVPAAVAIGRKAEPQDERDSSNSEDDDIFQHSNYAELAKMDTNELKRHMSIESRLSVSDEELGRMDAEVEAEISSSSEGSVREKQEGLGSHLEPVLVGDNEDEISYEKFAGTHASQDIDVLEQMNRKGSRKRTFADLEASGSSDSLVVEQLNESFVSEYEDESGDDGDDELGALLGF